MCHERVSNKARVNRMKIRDSSSALHDIFYPDDNRSDI